jgi:hypothetical protein
MSGALQSSAARQQIVQGTDAVRELRRCVARQSSHRISPFNETHHRITQLLPRRPRSLSVPLAPPPPLGRLPIATLAASWMASCTPLLCLAEHSEPHEHCAQSTPDSTLTEVAARSYCTSDRQTLLVRHWVQSSPGQLFLDRRVIPQITFERCGCIRLTPEQIQHLAYQSG